MDMEHYMKQVNMKKKENIQNLNNMLENLRMINSMEKENYMLIIIQENIFFMKEISIIIILVILGKYIIKIKIYFMMENSYITK